MGDDFELDVDDVVGLLRAVQPTNQAGLLASHHRAEERLQEAATASARRTRFGTMSGIAEGGVG